MEFSQLPKEIQQQLIKLVMQGMPPSPANQNRATQALQSNPQLVMKLLKQSGLDKELGDAGASDPDADGDTDNADPADDMDFGSDPNDSSEPVPDASPGFKKRPVG